MLRLDFAILRVAGFGRLHHFTTFFHHSTHVDHHFHMLVAAHHAVIGMNLALFICRCETKPARQR